MFLKNGVSSNFTYWIFLVKKRGVKLNMIHWFSSWLKYLEDGWQHNDFYLNQKSAFVSEPAILVKRENKGSQVWSMEKLENKLIDMREHYEEYKDKDIQLTVSFLCYYLLLILRRSAPCKIYTYDRCPTVCPVKKVALYTSKNTVLNYFLSIYFEWFSIFLFTAFSAKSSRSILWVARKS